MGFFDGFFDSIYYVVHKGESLKISGRKVLTIHKNNLQLIRTNSDELILYGNLPQALKDRSRLETDDNTKIYKGIKQLIDDAYDLDMSQNEIVKIIAEQLGIDFFYKNLSEGEWLINSRDREDSLYGDEYFYGGKPNNVNDLYFDRTKRHIGDDYESNYTYLNVSKRERFASDKYLYWLRDGNYFISGGRVLDKKGNVDPHLKYSDSIVSSLFHEYNQSFYDILRNNNLKIAINKSELERILEIERESYKYNNQDKQKIAELIKKSIYIP